MNRMRIHGQLCDIQLRSGVMLVSAHRVVLAAVSPYFHAMFNGEDRESVEIIGHSLVTMILAIISLTLVLQMT